MLHMLGFLDEETLSRACPLVSHGWYHASMDSALWRSRFIRDFGTDNLPPVMTDQAEYILPLVIIFMFAHKHLLHLHHIHQEAYQGPIYESSTINELMRWRRIVAWKGSPPGKQVRCRSDNASRRFAAPHRHHHQLCRHTYHDRRKDLRRDRLPR